MDGETEVAVGPGDSVSVPPALPNDDAGPFFCELTTPRPGDGGALATIVARLAAMPVEELRRRGRA